MKKRFLIGALALALMTPTTARADGIIDYSQYDFTSSPIADSILLEDTNITNVDGKLTPCIRTIDDSDFAELQLDDLLSNYKVLEFMSGDTNSWLGYFEVYTVPNETGDYTKVSLTSTLTLDEVLSESDVVSGGTVLNTIMQFKDNETDNYLLFFSENATDIDGLEFIISFDDLFTYEYIDAILNIYEAPETSVKSTEILKDNEGVVEGCRVSMSYNFKNENEYPVAIIPEDAKLISLNSKEYSGSFSFDYLTEDNGTYELTILTNMSNEYDVEFNIDKLETIEEPTEEIVKVDEKVPNISVEGNLEEKVVEGTDVTITIVSDIEVSMNFNGSDLGKGTKFTTTVDKNDEYHYTATTLSGVLSEGSYVVDCFEKAADITELVDDEIVAKLVEVGEDTGDKDELDGIAQTGIESTSLIGVSILLLIVGVVVIVVARKRGSKYEEN